MLFFDSACDGSAKLRNFPRGGADQLQRRVAYICEEMSRKIVDLAEMILEKRSGSADLILGKHVKDLWRIVANVKTCALT